MAYIQFQDPQVEAILLANGIGDGSGITIADCAVYTGTFGDYAGGWFKNQPITSFNEFVYFTSITKTPYFEYCSSLESIVLPINITEIVEYAFSNCTKLRTVNIPNNVTEIKNATFKNCTSLGNFIIPDNVTVINDGAFSGADIEKLFIGNGLTNIQDKNLISSVKGSAIFKGSTPPYMWKQNSGSMRGFVYVPSGSYSAYYDASGLSNYKTKIKEYTENTITFEDANVFNFLVSKGIGSSTGITYDQAAAYTGDMEEWFSGRTDTYYFDEFRFFTGMTSVGDYAFYGTYMKKITLPDTITHLGFRSFAYSLWKRFTIPDSVVSTDEQVFRTCRYLESVHIGSGLTTLEYGMFHGTNALSAITIPDTVQTIKNRAIADYSDETGLKNVYIGSGTTNIENYAFGGAHLEYITVDPNNPVYDSRNNCNAIIKTDTNTLVCGSSNTVIPNTVVSIAQGAFLRRTFQSFVIPDNVTSIGESAFGVCSALTTVQLPAFIKNLDRVFYRCTQLTNIRIPEGVESISSTFEDCSGLTSIYVPDSVNTIYTGFWYCENLKNIVIGSGLTRIGAGAFYSVAPKNFTLIRTVTPPLLTEFIVPADNTIWNTSDTSPIYVPDQSVTAYKTATGWVRYKDRIKGISEFSGLTMNISPETMAYTGATPHNINVTINTVDNYGTPSTYYTTDGTDPTSASTLYTEPFIVTLLTDDVKIVKAKAVSSAIQGYYVEDTAIYSSKEKAPTPSITPDSGNYYEDIPVTITSFSVNGTTHYTLDGSEPTTASTIYSGSFTLNNPGNITVKAIDYSDFYRQGKSDVATKNYVLYPKAVEVSIDPATSNYGGYGEKDITVTINHTGYTGNQVNIYYTTDGTAPSEGSTPYTEPFTLTLTTGATTTVRAIAVTYNGTRRHTATDTAVYKLFEKAPIPTITPGTGTYADGVMAEIYSVEDATVYYTLDGTTPTTESNKYEVPFYVNSSLTITAIAESSNYPIGTSDPATADFTIYTPQSSKRAPRQSDNNNGIYVKNVTYSGISANYRSAYILPSAITVNDNEADITWGYHVDNEDENLGNYGTRCKVTDTNIIVHVEFTHGGKQHVLEKKIPCTCVVQDAIDNTDTIDIIEAHAIVTLENQLRVVVKARVKHSEQRTVSVLADLTNYTLSGTSTNGNFLCQKDGSYFNFDDVLTLDYSGSTHPANDIELTLVNNQGYQLDHHVIQVTFDAGSIFEVRDDAIRMAVQSAITYTDGEISGVTNHLSQLEINISGITGTVSAITNTVSGISADVSQLQQTVSSLTSDIYNISGDMVTHSELAQTASSITAQVVDEVGEITGMFISAGTITLDASKTIITGQLSVDDGIAFYDDNGNLAVTVDGDDIGTYAQQTNGSIAYKYVYHSEANTTGYQFTTNKEPIGQYKSGDTISFNYLAEWCTLTPNGNGTATWDTASANTMQVQLYVGNASEPFSSTTVTLTGDTNSPMRTRKGTPICEFTIPSDGTVYVKYAFTSSASSQVGTRSAQVSAQIGFSDANAVKIGKGGASLAHAANYLTYLGADDTVLRKGTTGIKYGTWGTDQYNMRTGLQIAASTYHLSSGEFSEHPDNLSADTRIYWTPMYNYTPHTQATYCCDVYYGEITGYEGYGEKYNVRIREDKLYGDLWLDYLVNGSGDDIRGERIFVLLPPTTRQVVVDNKVAFHSLPEGYTVRIHNMGFYNGVYIAPNLMDGYSVSPASFYLPNGTREGSIYFNANDTFIELVYAGSYTLSDLGMRQLWYVRNQNNA